jgi:hypothetical protein
MWVRGWAIARAIADIEYLKSRVEAIQRSLPSITHCKRCGVVFKPNGRMTMSCFASLELFAEPRPEHQWSRKDSPEYCSLCYPKYQERMAAINEAIKNPTETLTNAKKKKR